jgi:tetratricopeptide (TPR) repeat protein
MKARIVLLSWFAFGLLWPTLRGSGADLAASFDEANKLYEQGRYSDAIAHYDALLQRKEVSPALYFNLGNAYFKSGKPGQAIVCYRLAQRLDPRDPDIRANLRFARESVGSTVPGLRGWRRWLTMLTLNELTLAAAAAVWIWFAILIAGQLRRDWVQVLRPYRIVGGLVAAAVVAWLVVVLQSRIGSSAAVVISRETPVRYGPFEEAQSFYTARDGMELAILDRKDDWFQVSDGGRRVGWVKAKDLAVLPRS